jgi:hypothetical protein
LWRGPTPGPYLDAIGIDTHLERLSAGEIDAETPTQYATDLQRLNDITAVAAYPTTSIV